MQGEDGRVTTEAETWVTGPHTRSQKGVPAGFRGSMAPTPGLPRLRNFSCFRAPHPGHFDVAAPGNDTAPTGACLPPGPLGVPLAHIAGAHGLAGHAPACGGTGSRDHFHIVTATLPAPWGPGARPPN